MPPEEFAASHATIDFALALSPSRDVSADLLRPLRDRAALLRVLWHAVQLRGTPTYGRPVPRMFSAHGAKTQVAPLHPSVEQSSSPEWVLRMS